MIRQEHTERVFVVINFSLHHFVYSPDHQRSRYIMQSLIAIVNDCKTRYLSLLYG
jgi:hypothetical protein